MRWLCFLVVLGACGGSSTSAIGTKDGGAVPPGTPSGGADASADASRDGVDPGLIRCGDTVCNASSEICCANVLNNSAGATCQPATSDACQGVKVECDEAADCPIGNVCCTEPTSFGNGAKRDGASCRPSCVTGEPRVQVCKTNAECQSGSCRNYDDQCKGYEGLMFCQRPENCQ